jgi:hypothetical protein
MKKTTLTLCLIAWSAIHLFSQQPVSKRGAAPDSGYIAVDGGRLYYEMAGEGDNIVLLHDGMVNHQIWDEQFPVLVRNYHVVRYDRRTYGK